MHIAREHRWKFCYLADMLHSDGVRVLAVTATATAWKEVVKVSLVLYLRAEKKTFVKTERRSKHIKRKEPSDKQ